MIKMRDTTLWKTFNAVFQVACFVATFGTLIWCSYEFANNEDLCKVTFKKYNKDTDATYPHISICLELPFSRNEYERYGKEILEKYFEFLSGKSQDQKWLNCSYDDFTFKIEEHLITAFVESPRWSGKTIEINTTVTHLGSMKCFTIDLPSGLKIYHFWLAVKNSIFPIGIGRAKGSFLITITYPHELFRTADKYVVYWPIFNNATTKSYMTDFQIKNVEVLKRRSTSHNACIQSRNYDEVMMKWIMGIVNCTPSYWNLEEGRNLPLCTTLSSYKQTARHMWDAVAEEGQFERHSSPCKQIKRLDQSLTDFQIDEIDQHAMDVINSQGKCIPYV